MFHVIFHLATLCVVSLFTIIFTIASIRQRKSEPTGTAKLQRINRFSVDGTKKVNDVHRT